MELFLRIKFDLAFLILGKSIKKKQMKLNLNRSLLLASLLGAFSLKSQTQQTINLSTGFNNTTGTLYPLNSIDDTWKVLKPSGVLGSLATCSLSAWQNSASSRWVSNVISSSGTAGEDVAGVYEYKATFNLIDRVDCGKLIINHLGGDNRVLNMKVNGVAYSLSLPSGDHFNPMINSQMIIHLNPSDLTSGTNTISFRVQNDGYTYTGFNFSGEIMVNSTTSVLPNVTGPSEICQGSPLTFNGSLNAGSDPSTHYMWSISECDAAGNIVSGGFNWYFWYVGIPSGNYTFPSSLNLTCGKYYVAVMAAVVDPACSNWAQDFVVFKYNCTPTSNAGVDQTICEGECTTLVSNFTKLTNTTWSTSQGVISNSSSVTVCPDVTTTYTLTKTNTGNGCSSSDQVVVNVLPNNPRFNISTNVSNPNYFTVTATPVVTNANLFPGFGAYWSVEELDANNNSLYNFQNPSAWYPYPTACTFKGFDDYNLNYSGIYTSVPSSPTNGQFVYNKTYRITRGTWNNNCSWNAFSYILKTVKSASGEPQVIVEETKAPNFIDEKPESINLWSVSPNPSSGIFAISNPSYETKETTFEIYDLFGKKVLEKTLEPGLNATTIDIRSQINGMYILRISSEGETFTHKIILE